MYVVIRSRFHIDSIQPLTAKHNFKFVCLCILHQSYFDYYFRNSKLSCIRGTGVQSTLPQLSQYMDYLSARPLTYVYQPIWLIGHTVKSSGGGGTSLPFSVAPAAVQSLGSPPCQPLNYDCIRLPINATKYFLHWSLTIPV